MLIGGFAVMAHGASRFTKDIDLLVDDDPENVARVKHGLRVLADNAAAELADTDVRDHVVVRVADEVIVDLMAARVAWRTTMSPPTWSGTTSIASSSQSLARLPSCARRIRTDLRTRSTARSCWT